MDGRPSTKWHDLTQLGYDSLHRSLRFFSRQRFQEFDTYIAYKCVTRRGKEEQWFSPPRSPSNPSTFRLPLAPARFLLRWIVNQINSTSVFRSTQSRPISTRCRFNLFPFYKSFCSRERKRERQREIGLFVSHRSHTSIEFRVCESLPLIRPYSMRYLR